MDRKYTNDAYIQPIESKNENKNQNKCDKIKCSFFFLVVSFFFIFILMLFFWYCWLLYICVFQMIRTGSVFSFNNFPFLSIKSYVDLFDTISINFLFCLLCCQCDWRINDQTWKQILLKNLPPIFWSIKCDII